MVHFNVENFGKGAASANYMRLGAQDGESEPLVDNSMPSQGDSTFESEKIGVCMGGNCCCNGCNFMCITCETAQKLTAKKWMPTQGCLASIANVPCINGVLPFAYATTWVTSRVVRPRESPLCRLICMIACLPCVAGQNSKAADLLSDPKPK
jgi:hypothetical protein